MTETHSNLTPEGYALEGSTSATYMGKITQSHGTERSCGRRRLRPKEEPVKLRPEGEAGGNPVRIRGTACAKAQHPSGLGGFGDAREARSPGR